MQVARSPRYAFGRQPESVRDRAGAVALTLTVYAVMLAILAIFGGSPLARIKAEDALNTMLVTPPAPPPPREPPARREGGSPKLHKLAPEPAPVLATAAPAVIAPIVDLPKTEFAEEGPASAASGPAQTGGTGNGTDGTGTGTGNQSGSGGPIIYKAEWQKLNSPAELNRNMPRSLPPGIGWGEIVCRASAKFRVTDCKLWGESPKGSGYGKAVLGIADLFRVKPPIVDGKPQIGAFVLIHIGYYNSRPPLY
jgi:hypothetical protein